MFPQNKERIADQRQQRRMEKKERKRLAKEKKNEDSTKTEEIKKDENSEAMNNFVSNFLNIKGKNGLDRNALSKMLGNFNTLLQNGVNMNLTTTVSQTTPSGEKIEHVIENNEAGEKLFNSFISKIKEQYEETPNMSLDQVACNAQDIVNKTELSDIHKAEDYALSMLAKQGVEFIDNFEKIVEILKGKTSVLSDTDLDNVRQRIKDIKSELVDLNETGDFTNVESVLEESEHTIDEILKQSKNKSANIISTLLQNPVQMEEKID